MADLANLANRLSEKVGCELKLTRIYDFLFAFHMANWFCSVFNVVCVVNVYPVHAVDLN